MRLVFNELSLAFPTSSIENGKDLMKELLLLYRHFVNIGLHKNILIKNNFNGMLLCEDYPIEKWRNDNSVDIELRRLFAGFNDKAEFINEVDYMEEFVCEKGKSIGLLVAALTDSIALSFKSDVFWNDNFIKGKVISINYDNLVEELAEAMNASRKDNISQLIEIIHQKKDDEKCGILTGIELWERKEELFPYLVFCDSVENQITGIQVAYIKQVIKKLDILNQFFKSWSGEAFNKNELPNVDPESSETLTRFKKEHTFKLPDGRELVFSYHIRYTGNYEGRIFFFPDNITRKGIIGHVGGKLPTVSWVNPN